MRFSRNNTRLVFTLVSLFCLDSLVKAQNLGPDTQTIFDRMIATYANLSSYQDSGVVSLALDDPLIVNTKGRVLKNVAMQSDTLVSFKTYYLRPNRFRFEWKSSTQAAARESVIWFDGKRAYLWMPTESSSRTFELTSSLDLGITLDQALSPSLGSVFFVPTLLLKKATVFPFADMLSIAKQVSIVREELVNGETCYVIKADLSGVPWLLWIGKESYLLRKTRTLYSARSFDDPSSKHLRQSVIAEEIHSSIRINRRVPKRLFRLRPVLKPQDLDLQVGKPVLMTAHP